MAKLVFKLLAALFCLVAYPQELVTAAPDSSTVDQFPIQTKTVIVTVREEEGQGLRDVLKEVERSTFSSRSDRLNGVVDMLEKFTVKSQSGILEFLAFMKANGHDQIRVSPLWITNKIIIRQADPVVIQGLEGRSDVSKVEDDPIFHISDPIHHPDDDNLMVNSTLSDDEEVNQNNVQWGVAAVKANEVWRSGTRGQNIVVATIDTGVRGSHVALKNNFRRNYGWFDPEEHTSTPTDNQGHGTHTTGTIAGTANGIGVAPGVQWIACKGCNTENCPGSSLMECGQWVSCPTDTRGNQKDCSKAPHIVSNSWGGSGNDNSYDDIISVWRRQGIIPVFSAGNRGPGCRTLGSPGDNPQVIGVGSTDRGDSLSEFSSMGPSQRGREAKPDVSAPGGEIVSASHKSDTQYAPLSGTSMACPHAAGVIALMLSKNNKLTYDQVKSALTRSCDPVRVTRSSRNCGGVSDSRYPNNNSGYGRINALKSVR